MTKPLKKYNFGRVSWAEWQGENSNSYSVQKSYKDKEGNWKNTDFMYLDDIKNVIIVGLKILLDNVKERQWSENNNENEEKEYTDIPL